MKTLMFLALFNLLANTDQVCINFETDLLSATVEQFSIVGEQAIVSFGTEESDLSEYEFATTQSVKFTVTDGGATVDVELTIASLQVLGGDVVMNFNLPSGGLSGLDIVTNQQIILENVIIH